MSFSKQVKREIIAAELPQKCCARAAAYAAACFFRLVWAGRALHYHRAERCGAIFKKGICPRGRAGACVRQRVGTEQNV